MPCVPAGEVGQCFVWCRVECNYREAFRAVPQVLSPKLTVGFSQSAYILMTYRVVSQPLSADGATVALTQFQRAEAVACETVELAGDVFFSFFLHRSKQRSAAMPGSAAASGATDELLAEVWIHTSFAADGVTLRRQELDMKLKSLPVPSDIAIVFDFGGAGDRGGDRGVGGRALPPAAPEFDF